jgi:hypothetical protein
VLVLALLVVMYLAAAQLGQTVDVVVVEEAVVIRVL